MTVLEETKAKMQAALEHFKQELRNLRSNRANPGMLDNVQVEVYGETMRLKELGNITSPESRQLLVTPFDPQTVSAIAKGIERANLNVQPIAERGIIRINIPPMDESTRKQTAKQAKEKAEGAKIVVREIRRKSNEQIHKLEADGIDTEDTMKKNEKKVQELTDQFCKEIDALFVHKEKEILTV